METGIIRKLLPAEYSVLRTFLYHAIFLPDGVTPPPFEIVEQPELQVYTRDFGAGVWDTAFCAETNGRIVGAAWARIMDDYGHLDDETPSIAISLLPDYRGMGLGTKLLDALLTDLRLRGCKAVSLSVQQENPAVRLYRRTGFQTVAERGEEYLMRCQLR